MPSNYREKIAFTYKVGANTRHYGLKVSDDLCVATATPWETRFLYKIFSVESGRPVVDLLFKDVTEAINIAKRLDKTYREFWFLLSEYPKMNVPQVTMWTVPSGIQSYLAIESLENRKFVSLTQSNEVDTITEEDLKRAFWASKDKVEDYMKFPQKG